MPKSVEPKPKKAKSKLVPKIYRDIIAYRGDSDEVLPGEGSPICAKCTLDKARSKTPYMPYGGSEDPLITVVLDSVSRREDEAGEMGVQGKALFVRKFMQAYAADAGLDMSRVRFSSITRCAVCDGSKQNFKTRGGHCRNFLIQDLDRHRPGLIIPVGTAVLGLLSHKSNAQDWGGRVLTYRGWPDDWLTDKRFAKGHPVFGQAPDWRVPMIPLQQPGIVWSTQNPRVINRWKKALRNAMRAAVQGVPTLSYDRPWYRITTDVGEIKDTLQWLADHPGTVVTYDTETTGIKPFGANQKIVFMMFRWEHEGRPMSIGFPWEYTAIPEVEGTYDSPLINYIAELSPYVLAALYASKLQGHNLTFDVLYTYGTVPGADLKKLADAMSCDTWHTLFTLLQQPGSLGLELMAYDWVPDLAGYEEEMTLLIEKEGDAMAPQNNKGGHYANCPPEFWDTHLKAYVMGDVEVCHQGADLIRTKLAATGRYTIPLAHSTNRGRFRFYSPPNREFVYNKIMSPAARMITKVMGRGMWVNLPELDIQESLFPKQIRESRLRLKNVDDRIIQWCEQNEATTPGWELDLENKEQLKTILFKLLELPITRLTKDGRKRYGEEDYGGLPEDILYKYAAVDKYTLNTLSVDHPNIRPLQEYRKIYKQYTSFVRPLRNIFSEGVDKKERKQDQHLMPDNCVHASFLLTGTRGGRLCVAGGTLLEIKVGDKRALEFVEIKDLWKFNGQLVYIRTHENRWKQIKAVYYKGREEMYSLRTVEGAFVKATGRHRLQSNRGWSHVSDLSKGDTLRIDLQNWVGDSADGEELCGLADHSGNFAQGSSRRSSAQGPDPQRKAVWDNLRRIAEEVSFTAAVRSAKGKQERSEVALSASASGGYSATSGCGVRGVADGSTLRMLCVFSGEELELLRREIGPEDYSSGSKCFEEALHGTHRQNFSRLEWHACRLARDSSGIPFERLRCLPELSEGCLVFEGFVQGTDSLCQGETSGSGRGGDLLVGSSPRSGTELGTFGQGNTVLERIPAALESQEKGRFCSDRDKHFGGAGRGVSRESRGRGEGSESVGGGLYHSSILDSESDLGHPERNGNDCGYDFVASVRSIGCEAVWDIEVEDDHSYWAGGLCHHNSSRNPNLQQLPRDGIVKRIYGSRFGDAGAVYQGDLSQIELRLLASACGDPSMVHAYNTGEDLHSLTTSKIYNIPYEHFGEEYTKWLDKKGEFDVIKDLSLKRKVGKGTNFLTGYGGGAFGLMNMLAMQGVYLSLEQCDKIIRSFFDSYPTLKKHISYYKKFIQENGCAVSLFGRVRIFEEVYGDDKEAAAKALRAGYNHLIQSTASDMMLLSLVAIENLMCYEGLESMLVSTVHDSLVIDARVDELDKVHECVTTVMENIPDVLETLLGTEYDLSWARTLPFGGDYEVGRDYLNARKIKGARPDWDELLTFEKAK